MKQHTKFIVIVSLMCNLVSIVAGKNVVSDANELFTRRGQRDIEVVVPRPGFIGSNHPSGRPLVVPRWPVDYDRKYVRITVEEKYPIDNGIRIVLKLDETDPNGIVKSHPDSHDDALFYAYLDVQPGHYNITGTLKGYHKMKEFRKRSEPIGKMLQASSRGIPFPLLSTLPLSLNPNEHFKDNSVYEPGRCAFVYGNIAHVENSSKKSVSIVILRKTNSSSKSSMEKKYYTDKNKTISNTQSPDSVEMMYLYEENQKWSIQPDWLWEEMERRDSDGNIIMRCVQVNGGG